MTKRDNSLYDLIISCPLHNCPKTCPIEQMRNLSVQERIEKLNRLNKEESMNLITAH